MSLVKYTFIFIAFIAFTTPGTVIDPGKKIDKEIKKSLEIDSYTYKTLNLSEDMQRKTPSTITPDNFFVINTEGKLAGYTYVNKAPSKTAQFDYLVILDKNLKIVEAKVLVYREEYGGEIGSRRWLSQFIGMKNGDSMNEIAAISGATISVHSMKKAVSNLLKSVTVLRENKRI